MLVAKQHQPWSQPHMLAFHTDSPRLRCLLSQRRLLTERLCLLGRVAAVFTASRNPPPCSCAACSNLCAALIESSSGCACLRWFGAWSCVCVAAAVARLCLTAAVAAARIVCRCPFAGTLVSAHMCGIALHVCAGSPLSAGLSTPPTAAFLAYTCCCPHTPPPQVLSLCFPPSASVWVDLSCSIVRMHPFCG